uniref:serine-rich adhesin for platelets-like isoform X3 n=1 Tax=Scatophagus argus TaxID=75038 RepID=UPI001ED82854|nr:serine-rich adhesin for platelets-like isoform X3 [Scatophagus argus]
MFQKMILVILYVRADVVTHTCIFTGFWTISVFSFIMAGCLLFIILMPLRRPKLTVNPTVITQTDSVTLNCQTPSSVSVSQCYFVILRGETIKSSSCLKILTGTELLRMSSQSSPAEVKVNCYFTVKEPNTASPPSDTSSITIHILHPPKLTVNPLVITQTDSVTLNCQAPSSVSVSQCFFYTGRQQSIKGFSCLRNLTGTELLLMARQSSSAKVEVRCFYTVKLGELDSPSPHSNTSSITIHILHPPKLTVNPLVITQTDSVTLNCQAPSSVSVSQCFFYTGRQQSIKGFSCLRNLTGTELLLMARQSSSAKVEVRCFYTVKLGELDSPSPHSNTSSITIHILHPPKLTVNPLVITQTDSVTLNCQAPSSVSVSQCFFNTGRQQSTKVFSCLSTLTGTELLLMARQSSPAKVEVRCFYTVKLGELDSPSPHSNTSSITIHTQKPEMSLQHFPGDYVLFACSLPGSANPDTRCNLYFGEGRHLVATSNISSKTNKKNQWFCQFYVTIDDLLSRLRSVQQRDASCDYSVGSEPNSLSPRSDGYSLAAIVENESSRNCTQPAFTDSTVSKSGPSTTTTTTTTTTTSSSTSTSTTTSSTSTSSTTATTTATATTTTALVKSASAVAAVESHMTQTTSTFAITTDLTVSRSHTSGFNLTFTTPAEPASERIWKLAAVGSGIGVTVGVILLALTLLCTKRRTGQNLIRVSEKRSQKRTQSDVTDDFICMTNFNYEALEISASGTEKLNRQRSESEEANVYHVYCTIPDKPPPSSLDMVYSTVQPH